MKKYIYTRLGIKDPDVIVGPQIGEDSAVIDIGNDKVLVVHSDGITGAVDLMGWLAIHIVSNDIAVTGAKPRWYLSTLYLPENTPEDVIDKITSQMDVAAKEIGVMIVGGHTEFTPKLERPLIATTAMGITDKNRFVRTGGAKPGDKVIMTKVAAIEGTAILSTDFREILIERGVKEEVLDSARRFIRNVSVVKEALALAERGLATSMHDPTEGGILGGLSEIAYASKTTLEIWEDKIPIASETSIICKALGIDPLRLISSGSLIATVPDDKVNEALEVLRSVNVRAEVIGEVKRRIDNILVILHRKYRTEKISDVYVPDELTRLWKIYV